jgi:MFS family permease
MGRHIAQTGIIGTSALIASAIGGVRAERIGRGRVLCRSDLPGRRKTVVLSAPGASLAILTCTFVPGVGLTLLLVCLAEMFQSGIVSGMGACFFDHRRRLWPGLVDRRVGGCLIRIGFYRGTGPAGNPQQGA